MKVQYSKTALGKRRRGQWYRCTVRSTQKANENEDQSFTGTVPTDFFRVAVIVGREKGKIEYG